MTRHFTTSKVWVVLTFGEDRQHAGNAGYDDAPERYYSYDSFVANHRQVAAGDSLLVCDRERALGIASITKIDEEPSVRILQRCPTCQGTGIKRRRTKRPTYRCKDGHEFEEPISETAGCTKYTAHFGDTFALFNEKFGREFLRPGCPRYSDQVAMQEFDFFLMDTTFRSVFPDAAALVSHLAVKTYIQAEAADTRSSEADGYKLSEGDYRAAIQRQIRARRGQQAFRNKLRSRYKDQCVISGCNILHVLEAAHICPYRGELDNHAENGLLLRADLHTFFDLDLIGIEPVTLAVHFHPKVNCGEYASFHGRVLLCPGKARPSKLALETRWAEFKKRVPMD